MTKWTHIAHEPEWGVEREPGEMEEREPNTIVCVEKWYRRFMWKKPNGATALMTLMSECIDR